jgi:hypothetical protein
LLVLIFGLATEVGAKLRSRWVDRLTDGVDYHLQALFSRYRRRYLKWLFYRHRDFDVKGLSTQGIYTLELEQVFVDLTIEPRAPHAASSDPIRFPEELKGRQQIWDYLTSTELKDNLALIGAPGSGKTTLLKKMALQLTGPRRPKIRQKLPILLFLREHAASIMENPDLSLAELASSDLSRRKGPNIPAAWFQKKLSTGRCLVLLDGLDEVASMEIRQKAVAWIEAQILAFNQSRFLISSRPHGYRNCPVAGLTVLEIQPFNRQQVRQFVHNWYRTNEIHAFGKLDPGVKMNAREGADDLLRRLGNSQTLSDLAVNPLLLTMIANVHRFRSSLPGRRVELYAEICEVFLGKRQQARGIETDLTPAQKQRVLQPLAYHLMCTKKRDVHTEQAVKVIAETIRRVAGEKGTQQEVEFLKEVENSSGLLLEREAGEYSFAHLAFQEYLTAVHIREQELGAELVGKVTDPWWHEVLRLYGAQGDASPILKACLSSASPSVGELSLAIDCLEEARETDPYWRAQVDSLVKESIQSLDPERFRLAAETMLARRLRDMIAIDDRTLVDPNYISHAEYQLFIDERRAGGEYRQPDHWQRFRFPDDHGLTPAVGMRPSDAKDFCDWLSARDSAFEFRLPESGELEKHCLQTVPEDKAGSAEGYWEINSYVRVRSPRKRALSNYLEELIVKDILRMARSRYRFGRAFNWLFRHILGLDSVSVLDLGRNLDRVLDRVRDLGLDRDRIRDLGRDRVRDLLRDILRDILRDFVSVHVHGRDFILDLDLDLVLDLVLDLDRDRDLDLDRGLGIGLGLDLVSVRNLDLDLDSDLVSDLDLDLDLGLDTTRLKLRNYQRHQLRMLTFCLMATPKVSPTAGNRRWFHYNRPAIETARSWRRTYRILVILEARIDGFLPAIEGIRIIKERRTGTPREGSQLRPGDQR